MINAAEPLPFGIPTPVHTPIPPPMLPPMLANGTTGISIQDMMAMGMIQEQSARRRHEEIIQMNQLNQFQPQRRQNEAIQSIKEPQLHVYTPFRTPQRSITPATTTSRSRTYSHLPDIRANSPVQGDDVIGYIN